MTTYYVWDSLNQTREDAQEITAADTPEGAAELYAEFDTDGVSEGLYGGNGFPLNVLAEGETEPTIYKVTVDWDPIFNAVRA